MSSQGLALPDEVLRAQTASQYRCAAPLAASVEA